MSTINIKGLDKAQVLLALWHRGEYKGLGHLAIGSTMTPETAQAFVGEALANAGFGETCYFDYVLGRVIKTDIGLDELNPRLYDRDNGQGAAQAALQHLLDARDAQPTTAPDVKMYLAGKLKYPAKQGQIDEFKARVAAGTVFAEVDRPVRLPEMSDLDWMKRFSSIDENRVCAQITHVDIDAAGWVSVAIKPHGPQRDVIDESRSLSFGARAAYADDSATIIITVDLTGVDLQA